MSGKYLLQLAVMDLEEHYWLWQLKEAWKSTKWMSKLLS
jgi:hypothetical protein